MRTTDSVLRTKPVEDVIAQAADPVEGEGHEGVAHRLARRLTAKDLMGFGIGIGTGTHWSPNRGRTEARSPRRGLDINRARCLSPSGC